MSLHITAHINPTTSVKHPRNERANPMAVDLKALYAAPLAACTNADEVLAVLRTMPNPRLVVEAPNDNTVKVFLQNDPKNILLLTITAN